MGISFDDVPNLALGLGFIAVVVIVVFLMLADLGSNATVAGDANATNAVNQLKDAGQSVVDWGPTWGLMIGVGTVIGILGLAFGGIIARRGGGY